MLEGIHTPTEIKQRLPLAYACARLGIALTSDGRAHCPFHSDRDPSFRIWTGNDGVERFACFPCEIRGGDVFDLIERLRGCDFAEAVEIAERFLAELPDDHEPPPRRCHALLTPDHWRGQIEDARLNALRPEYAGALAVGCGFPPGWGAYLRDVWGCGVSVAGTVYMPHWDASGALIGCKIRRGAQKKAMPGSRFTSLYGSWRPRRHSVVLLAEGETDAAWAAAQATPLDVYALPRGAASSVELEWLRFLDDAFVVLAFDADEAGAAATASWSLALGANGIRHDVLGLRPGTDLRESAPDLAGLQGLANAGRCV